MKIISLFIISTILIIITFILWGESLEADFQSFLLQLRKAPEKYAVTSFLILTSDIVLPVPSSITMFMNGGVLGFWFGFLLSLFSVLCSSVIGYYLGFGFAYGRKTASVEKAEQLLHTYGPYLLLLTRGIPILSESFCFICGYSKMNFGKYMLLNFLGYLPVCILYSYFGSISKDSDLFLWSFAGALLIAAMFAFFGTMLKKRTLKTDI